MSFYVPSNRVQQLSGHEATQASDGASSFASRLSSVDKRVWVAAGAVSVGILAAVLYKRRWGVLPGRGPLMPPDDPSGKLYEGDGTADLNSLAEASWRQGAAVPDAAEARGSTPAMSEIGEEVSAASAELLNDRQCKDEHERRPDALDHIQKIFATSSLHADGGISVADDKLYCWSQDAVAVVVETSAKGLKRSQVKVDIKPTRLLVKLGGKSIIDGKLKRPVHPEDSTWQMEDGLAGERRVIITLTKAVSDNLWESLLAA